MVSLRLLLLFDLFCFCSPSSPWILPPESTTITSYFALPCNRPSFLINKFFIVILQVSTDSQLTEGSDIKDNKKFIYEVIKDFAKANLNNINLVFKHHPRDRGYTNYNSEVNKFSKEFGIGKNVFYIHDYFL